jgi:hypothetical protein
MAVSNSIDRFNGVIASKAIKVRCVLGAILDVPLLEGAQTIEGIGVATGDRVLLTAQTNPVLNGIYDVVSGPWTRAPDWDGNRDVELGSTVWAGTQTGLDILYQVMAPSGTIIPGSTAVTVAPLFDPNAPAAASNLADVTAVGNDTLGLSIVISQTDPVLFLKDNNSTFSQATGRVQWLDSADAEVARVEVSQTELILSTINGGIEITPSGGNAVSIGYAIQLTEMSSVITPAAGLGRLWLRDDATPVLVFTDDAGADTVLGAGSAPGGVSTNVQYNNGGAFGGDANFAWDAANATLNLDNSPGAFTPSIDVVNIDPGGVVLQMGGVGSGSTNWDIFRSFDNGGGLNWALRDDHALSSGNHRLQFLNGAGAKFIELDNSDEMRLMGGESVEQMYLNTSGTVAVRNGATLYLEQTTVNGNITGHGQLYVEASDDSLHYVTEAGVDTDLTAGGGLSLPTGGTTNSILKWNGSAWVEEANILAIAAGANTLEIRGSGAFLHLHTTGAAADEKETRIKMDNFAGFAIQSVTDGGSNGPFLMGANRTGSAWQHLQISVSMDIFGSLYLDDALGVQADILTQGQLYVDSADDSLHYRTGAGVDTDLTAAGGVTTLAALTDTDVAGVADHDMLFFDTASGDWKDTGGNITAQPDAGSTIGMTINSAASGEDGSLVINNGAAALGGLLLGTNVASGYNYIQTSILGNTELWLIAENGGEPIVMKASEVRIAGGTPSVDYVGFSDDDVDFNTVGNSKVDWNINGFTGSIRIIGMDLNLGDSDLMTFGTGDDCSFAWDGASTLDLNIPTDDFFYIQEAGTDRFGFNHLNNRFEILTGNRLLAYSSDNLEWMEYYHDGSDGHISTGGTNPGSIIFESAIVHLVPTDTVSANAVTLATEDSNGFDVDLEPATAAVVITLGGSPPTGYYVASVRVQQDGATAQTITFAGGVILNAGGTLHPVTTTLDGITIYTVETWDGGTTWHISGVDYS